MRKLTLYRDDSTTQVVFEHVKHYFFTANNTVLTIAQVTNQETGEHQYISWPRERFCWFRDEPEEDEKPKRRISATVEQRGTPRVLIGASARSGDATPLGSPSDSRVPQDEVDALAAVLAQPSGYEGYPLPELKEMAKDFAEHGALLAKDADPGDIEMGNPPVEVHRTPPNLVVTQIMAGPGAEDADAQEKELRSAAAKKAVATRVAKKTTTKNTLSPRTGPVFRGVKQNAPRLAKKTSTRLK